MNFVEAIRVIKNIIPQCSANEYDGILVKDWKRLIPWMRGEQLIRHT